MNLSRVSPSVKVDKRQVIVSITALATVAAIYFALGFSTELWRDEAAGRKSDGVHWRLSMATGTASLLFLSSALAIGPVRRLRGEPTPIHLPWRRTLGVTAAVMAWVHIGFGITIHTIGWRLWAPFTHLWQSSGILFAFGVAVWVGLAAGVLLVPLAVSSNSASIRRLGGHRWKRIQRSAYLVVFLLSFHIVGVQVLEARDLRHAPLPLLVIGSVGALQLTGYVSTRRFYRGTR